MIPHYRVYSQRIANEWVEIRQAAELIDRLPAAIQSLDDDLARFRQFLDSASHADEVTSGK